MVPLNAEYMTSYSTLIQMITVSLRFLIIPIFQFLPPFTMSCYQAVGDTNFPCAYLYSVFYPGSNECILCACQDFVPVHHLSAGLTRSCQSLYCEAFI